jgi:hypothetical protein
VGGSQDGVEESSVDVHWMAVQSKALKKLRMVPQQEEVDRLTLRLIGALNVQTSVSKQETAVCGKLVSSLTMVTDEPFKKYTGLKGAH